MPKFFPLKVDVEEVALGPVLRLLKRTGGVVRVDILDDEPKSKGKANGAANGHAGQSHRRQRVQKEINGEHFLLQALARTSKPLRATDLAKLFEADGRASSSYASMIHHLKKTGLADHDKDKGYTISRKGRTAAAKLKKLLASKAKMAEPAT